MSRATTTTSSPLYARLLGGLVRPFPNFDFPFIVPVRARAAALLRLQPGARVLDAGCGSGGSFVHLVRAVGEGGQVVGIELDPGSASQARRRIAANGWKNVEVVEGSAEQVDLDGTFDGLLMFAAPDLFAGDGPLRNLLPRLRPGARIVFFGAKTSTRRMGWLLNGPIDLALTRFSLPTTPGLEERPWRHLAPRLRELEVEELFHGAMFLAAGTYDGGAPA